MKRGGARAKEPFRIVVVGAGKVGRTLARGLEAARFNVALLPSRRALPAAVARADVVILAVRDDQIRPVAVRIDSLLASAPGSPRPAAGRRPRRVVVHCAGARGPDELALLRTRGIHVGQMHPLLSIADGRRSPSMAGATLLVSGDAAAVRRARQLGIALGMTPRVAPRLDAAVYHAAASTLANGAVALAAVGVELLVAAGFAPRVATRMLGPLLRSVGDNLERLGLPAALTGPVRRGDRTALERHLDVIERVLPGARTLYLELARGQIDLARRLSDAEPEALDDIVAWLASRGANAPRHAVEAPHRTVARPTRRS